jgi:hypothetical protein
MSTNDQQYPIEIINGAAFHLQVQYQDEISAGVYQTIDLTNYTAKMQVRITPEDLGSPIISLVSGTTGFNNILISGTSGIVDVYISSTVTSTLSSPWSGYYDLFIYDPNGNGDRLLYGPVDVEQRVTR